MDPWYTIQDMLILRAATELLSEEDREKKWHIFAKRTEAQEDKVKPVMRALFTKQEKSVLGKMPRARLPKLPKGYLKAPSDEAARAANRYIEQIFSPEEWEAEFGAAHTKFTTAAMATAGNAAMIEVGAGVGFNVTNPIALEALKNRTVAFSKEVNDYTRERLTAAMAAGFDAGEGIPQLSQRVADVFEIAKGSRTNTIARTEIVGASNNGTFQGYVQSKIVDTKVWIDSRDSLVRESPHNHKIDGEERKLQERFSNNLMHPHDWRGEAGNIINCRCTIAAGQLK